MTAISGTRRSMKELSDGTIRVQIDIDPIHRATFFELFGQIDMPVAIAPLVADFEERPRNSEGGTEKPKRGPLATLAGRWCKEPKFWEWVQNQSNVLTYDEDGAKSYIYGACGISSRIELDCNPRAERLFHGLIREPYRKWLEEKK